jgi:zinc-ribbon domain
MAFCSECGKQISAESGFCPACGTPTQGEAVLAVPVPAVPAMPAVTAASTPAPPLTASPTAAPPAGAAGRWARILVPVGIGAVALVVVVVLLAKGLSGASGGADSPTAAVEQLAAAARVEDPAAAIALIDPDEARSLGTVYGKIRDALRPSGVIQSTGTVRGTHVAIQGLQLNAEQLSSDVAKVTISGGTLSAAVQASVLPAVFGVNRDSESRTDLGSSSGPGGAGLFLMIRKQEGRWYISPTLTVLQYIVELHGLAQPDFSTLDSRNEAEGGASSPGQLASALAQAVSGSNVNGVLSLASEREASAVQPYSAALQELVGRAGGSLQVQVSAPQFTETPLDSGLVRLNLVHAGFNVSIDGDESSQTIDGTLNGPCVNASKTTDTGTSSSNKCFSHIHSLLGVGNYFVVAEHAAGGLRLAPIATVLEYARLLVNHLGSTGIRRLLGTVTQEARARFSGSLSVQPQESEGG